MVKIKDPNEITIRRVSEKVYEVSTVYGGYYRHKVYMGYKKTAAIKAFKEDIRSGKI